MPERTGAPGGVTQNRPLVTFEYLCYYAAMKRTLADKIVELNKKRSKGKDQAHGKGLAQANVKGGILAGLGLAVAVACLTISGAFDSPSEIITPEVLSPTPVVDTLTMDEALDAAPEAEKHKARKKGLKASVKEKIQALPSAVRIGVVLPMYAAGMVLTKVLGAFFTTVMAPVLAAVLKWVIFALVVFLAIGLLIKAIFPDIPFSKIFTLKNFLYVLLAVVVLALLDKAMPLVFSDYRKWADVFKFTAGLLIVILSVVPVSVHFIKKSRDKKAMQTM